MGRRLPTYFGILFILLAVMTLASNRVQAAPSTDGDLDTTFGTGGKTITSVPVISDVQIYATAIQADGKIIAAGTMKNGHNSQQFAVARTNSDGSPDTSFGINGVASAFPHGNSVIYGVAVQPDGKIVAVGRDDQFEKIARFLSSGDLDTGFGAGGTLTLNLGYNGDIRAVAVMADGKIVVAGRGDLTAGTAADFVVIRLLPDGSFDPTFGNNGKVSTDFNGNNDIIAAITLQADDKIAVAGGSGLHFALARYLPNGNLDTGFGSGGKIITDLGSNDEGATAIGITLDGKIVAGGHMGTYYNPNFALIRYTSSGVLDPSFGNSGVVTTTVGTASSALNALQVLPGDKVVVAGYASDAYSNDFALAAYTPGGMLDNSFGNGGIVRTSLASSGQATALALRSNGDLLAVGYGSKMLQTGGYRNAVTSISYLPNGNLDTGFGSGGISQTLVFFSNAQANAVALQTDGKIVAAGPAASECVYGCDPNSFALTRYNADGTPDTTFGQTTSHPGLVTTTFSQGPAIAEDMAVQNDGKIVVAGHANTDSLTDAAFALARYMPDGSLDSSFGNGGKLITNVVSNYPDGAYALLIQPDSKIVAVGYNYSEIIILRYLSDGTLDPTFGYNGTVISHAASDGADIYAAALQPDGKIIVGGRGSTSCTETCSPQPLLLVRYMPDGQLDGSFGTNGVVKSVINNTSAEVDNLSLQSDGKIVAVGRVDFDIAVTRYTPNGTLDNTFGSGGSVVTDFQGGYDYKPDVRIQADGRIVVSCRAGGPNYAISAVGIARYLPNGSLDSTFGNGGKIISFLSSYGSGASALTIDTSNRIVVAGGVTLADSSTAFGVARYLAHIAPPATITPSATATFTPRSSTATLTPMPVATASSCAVQFSDVPSDSTFYPFVRCLACQNVLGGYGDGTFRPGNLVTRGQLAKIVSNAAGFSDYITGQTFEDVSPDTPFYQWVERLTSRGYMGGYACGGQDEPCLPSNRPYFRPGANATRGQTSKIVSNAAQLADTPIGQIFEDVDPGSPFYPWIERLALRGYMSGYPCGREGEPCMPGNRAYFRPSDDVTRGQSAKIVSNTFFPNCAVTRP